MDEEVLRSIVWGNETEPLVDEETCNSPGRHSRVPPMRESLRQSQALPGPLDERTYEAMKETAAQTRAGVSSASVGSAGTEVKASQNSLRLC